MKKIIAFAAIVLMSLSAFAQSGKSIYTRYSDEKGVEAVYISPNMFKLIGKIPDVNTGNGDVNLAPIIRNLSGFYLLSTSSPRVISDLSQDVQKLIRAGKYELMMEAKDDGETVRIYTENKGEDIVSLVFFSSEPDEVSFICVDGLIKQEELNILIEKSTR